MYEYGVVLWLRTRKIDKNLRKMIFLDACKVIDSLKLSNVLNKDMLIIYNIFKKNDYMMWKLYAIYKLLGVKFGVE